MKRHYPSPGASLVQQKKRHRASHTAHSMRESPSHFQDGLSDRHEAEEYRLATAQMPIDALSCVWRNGTNRHLDRRHVAKLCNLFKAGTLARRDRENYLLVQCSAEAVGRMTSHLGQPAQGNQVLSFEDWLVVNPDENAEVMAGQHRLEALREYVRQTGADRRELWWTCIIYDRDRIPAEIDVKLRVNRRDLSLPDSHGQIWMQLVLASGQCPSLFQGKKYDMEKQMRNILRPSAADKFPTARLATLWKNNRWRSMITRWCETRIGRETFNVSTWEWMASLRIDSYWFTTFELALGSLAELPEECVDSLQPSDWSKLAIALIPGRSETETRDLFYPGQTSDESGASRRQGFLQKLTDDAYNRVYRRTLERPELAFPNVQKVLKTTKEEGRIMMQVLTHVVAWLNPNPTVIVDKRQNNKPLIREDLKPALQERLRRGYNANAIGVDCSMAEEGQAVKLERLSIRLERVVLDAVCDQMELFKSMTIKESLAVMPNDDEEGYRGRFTSKPWSEILNKAQEITGPVFGSSPLPVTAQTVGSDRYHDAPALSSISRDIMAMVRQIPEVAQNPALRRAEAYQELSTSINQVVLEWSAKWRRHQQRDDCTLANNIPNTPRQSSGTGVPADRVRDSTGQMNSVVSQVPVLTHESSDERPLESQQGKEHIGKAAAHSQISWPPFQSLFSRNEH